MKWLTNWFLKIRIKNCFYKAGLFTQSRMGSKVIHVYPKILAINNKKDRLTINFSLLVGIDPAEVKKKQFVFAQEFGPNIELTGDLKFYTLAIYNLAVEESYDYNYDEIHPSLQGFKLGILAGKNRFKQYESFDMTKNPHILVAGETGSGKSTQLRSVLTTMILSKNPNELQLMLADCKRSEFHIFRKVEHVKCVHSDPEKIEKMLKEVKKELDERSKLTEDFEVSHVDDLPVEQKRPYIVVCIDEFVMLRKNETIMEILTELVAIGRTLGCFAILSMQRPSAKILDTTIRANLTVSMGFRLRDKTEARIVNTPDAEKIEVDGRFIFNSTTIQELQAPYLSIDRAKILLMPYYTDKNDTAAENKPLRKDSIPTENKDIYTDLFNHSNKF